MHLNQKVLQSQEQSEVRMIKLVVWYLSRRESTINHQICFLVRRQSCYRWRHCNVASGLTGICGSDSSNTNVQVGGHMFN